MLKRLSSSLYQSLLLVCLTALVTACGGGGNSSPGTDNANTSATPTPIPSPTSETPVTDLVAEGAKVYMEPRSNGNTFACAHCHALSEPMDSFTRPGHPIGDALRRPSFKNGELTSFIDAVNICLDEWMAVDSPWTESTEEFQELSAFLQDRDSGSNSGDTEPLSFEIATPLTFASIEEVNGNAATGRETFNASCAICHGENAVGTERAPDLAGRINDANLISRRVRTSGSINSQVYPELTGGRMPFWAEDRLSNNDLRDVIAYILASNTDDAINAPNPGDDLGDGQCSSSHPSIGKVATLTEKDHGVAGTATIIDDCTIELSNFSYDGRGIDVRVYGALNRDYSNGFSMGSNLVRSSPYESETVVVKLPENKTLDDINSISIWCVPVGLDFGDGVFN